MQRERGDTYTKEECTQEEENACARRHADMYENIG